MKSYIFIKLPPVILTYVKKAVVEIITKYKWLIEVHQNITIFI